MQFFIKCAKKCPKLVTMSLFEPIIARSRSHELWEAFGIPPGRQPSFLRPKGPKLKYSTVNSGRAIEALDGPQSQKA